MSGIRRRDGRPVSGQLYRLLLVLYPAEFRLRYGDQMEQAFRDLCREAARGEKGHKPWRVWLRAINDLARTAPVEHVECLLRRTGAGRSLRTDAGALAWCAALIVVAASLLGYARSNGVPSLLTLGPTLDAFASAGLVGNAITFVAAKFTRRKGVGLAYSVFSSIGISGCLWAMLSGHPAGMRAGGSGLALAYIVSCSLWCAVHRVAARR